MITLALIEDVWVTPTNCRPAGSLLTIPEFRTASSSWEPISVTIYHGGKPLVYREVIRP